MAVARLPQFQVAGYSLWVLAALLAYGFQRTAAFLPLPKWRGESIGPSVLDILNLLRQQICSRYLEAPAGGINSYDLCRLIVSIPGGGLSIGKTKMANLQRPGLKPRTG